MICINCKYCTTVWSKELQSQGFLGCTIRLNLENPRFANGTTFDHSNIVGGELYEGWIEVPFGNSSNGRKINNQLITKNIEHCNYFKG